jgi:hypothetical protein
MAVLGNLDIKRKNGKKVVNRANQLSKDSLEDAIFKQDQNALSRRDLSARHDETVPLS